MDAYSSEEDSDGETSKAIRKIMLSKRVTKRGKKNAKKVAKVLAKRKVSKLLLTPIYTCIATT